MAKIAEQKLLVKILKGPSKSEQKLIDQYNETLGRLESIEDEIHRFVTNVNNDKRRHYMSKVRYIDKLVKYSSGQHNPHIKFSAHEKYYMYKIHMYIHLLGQLNSIQRKVPAFTSNVDCMDIHECITQDLEI